MTWTEFIKPTKRTLLIFVLLFLATLIVLSLVTWDSPILILKAAFDVFPDYGCFESVKGTDYSDSCEYFPPTILFALPVFIVLYLVSCAVNYYLIKRKTNQGSV